MSKAYIITKNGIAAEAVTDLKNGTEVLFAFNRAEEHLNANREFNLVNARSGKISRAKKWEKYGDKNEIAQEINSGEFYIQTDWRVSS